MNFGKYTEISKQIYKNLKNEQAFRDNFLSLIIQSANYISEYPSQTSLKLHNKYVELGVRKYGKDGIDEYATTEDLKALELSFEKDPSDMPAVIRLAIEYSVCARQQRAQQLLNRVAYSGYPERAIATRLLQQLSSGEALK